MYIKRLFLKNVRCCGELNLEFDKLGKSILLCGENGDGKSTVLRCIAMGLCDETSAAGLLRELPGDFVKRGRKTEAEGASILVELIDNSNKKYEIITKIKSLEAFESLSQKVYIDGVESSQDNFPWEKIFVTAYGPGNRISGTADYQHYVAVDAVYSLFRNDVALQNPELVFRRAVDEAYKRYKKNPKSAKKLADATLDYLKDLIKQILNLNHRDTVELTKTGIMVKSSRWGKAELGALGDGYKSTTTWVLDLISWWMLNLKKKSFLKNKKIDGIVLIDEIEQHLHPKWQIKIMQTLNKSFGGVQFIATTHSPLVMSGCKEVQAYVLSQGKHEKRNVYGWLAEDVYHDVMGLETSRPESIMNDIETYEKLYLRSLHNKMTTAEISQLRNLRRKIRAVQGSEPITITTELSNLSDFLKKYRKS